MKLRVIQILLLIVGMSPPAESDAIPNEDIKPIYFAALDYPTVARVKHEQGVVVVLAKLDRDGNIISVEPISGPASLVQDSASNAKKWRFRPNAEGRVVIIYDFRIEGLCQLPCRSHFSFRPPNVATITTGEAVLDHN